MTDKQELLPCPFCGGEATRLEKLVVLENLPPNGAKTYYTGCENRGCINPYSHWLDQDTADKNWNTRAKNQREKELEEALEMMIEHYVNLAGCGDCGFWEPEEERKVIEARKILTNKQALKESK